MIISHKHKFIFIKNRKVGGTSIEAALSTICGPDDILTTDWAEGRAIDLAQSAQNWQGRYIPTTEFLYCRNPIDFARIIRDALKRPKWYDHMRATAVKSRIGTKIWQSYYKFCFERNPFSKSISYINFMYRGKYDINDYITNRPDKLTDDQWLPSDWARYTHRDQLMVDDIFDFADLEGNLQIAMTRAGVPEEERARLVLPRLKEGGKKNGSSRSLSEEAQAVIRHVFRREIACLGHHWYESTERPAETLSR